MTVPPAPADLDRTTRRAALVEQIADHVLQKGLGTMGLRGLARALDTSDRMLLYYFGTKDELITAAVGSIVTRLLDTIPADAADENGPIPPDVFLEAALAMAAATGVRPFMAVLSDVIARGGQGEAPYDRLADDLVRRWLDFIRVRVTGADTDPTLAPSILAVVEGLLLLERARAGSTAGAGTALIQRFRGPVVPPTRDA